MSRNTSRSTSVRSRFVETLEGRRLLSSTPVPLGDEATVNSYTAGSQSLGFTRSVDSAANGNYVVVWESNGSGVAADKVGVFAALYTKLADGSYAKQEVRVDTLGTNPAVGMDDSGRFVVAWVVNSGSKKQVTDVYARRFNADGTPADAGRMVNSYTAGTQQWPTVAAATGSYVIGWNSDGQDGSGHGVYAKRFTATGIEQAPPTGVPRGTGNEFRVNTYTACTQSYPVAAADDAGNFACAWTSSPLNRSVGQDGDGGGVYAQRFGAAGHLQGAEFQVNQTTRNWQQSPRIGMSGTGDFVVAWESRTDTSNDVYARRYGAVGGALSAEFLVDAGPILNGAGGSGLGGVAVGPSGAVLVTFSKYPPGNGSDAESYGQLYDANGTPHGDRFMVNQTITGDQFPSSAAFLSADHFVTAWTDYPNPTASLQCDVRMRTFAVPVDTSQAGTATSTPSFFATTPIGSSSDFTRDSLASIASQVLV
jgi:hypothetical protein